jgi:Big-like domain-containing protein
VQAENATGIAPGTNVTAFFSEAMKAGTVTNNVKLYKEGTTTALRATVTYDVTAKKATLNPSANLQPGAKYKAVVSTGATDMAGNPLDQSPTTAGNQPKSWTFTVRN